MTVCSTRGCHNHDPYQTCIQRIVRDKAHSCAKCFGGPNVELPHNFSISLFTNKFRPTKWYYSYVEAEVCYDVAIEQFFYIMVPFLLNYTYSLFRTLERLNSLNKKIFNFVAHIQ